MIFLKRFVRKFICNFLNTFFGFHIRELLEINILLSFETSKWNSIILYVMMELHRVIIVKFYLKQDFIKELLYRLASLLYAIDRDQKIRLAYNEFAYEKTKTICKLRDTFQKNVQFPIAYYQICR